MTTSTIPTAVISTALTSGRYLAKPSSPGIYFSNFFALIRRTPKVVIVSKVPNPNTSTETKALKDCGEKIAAESFTYDDKKVSYPLALDILIHDIPEWQREMENEAWNIMKEVVDYYNEKRENLRE